MSPRCSVMTLFDQKLTMYHTFFKFHWCYQKSVSNAGYIYQHLKKVFKFRERETHQCHHAAAKWPSFFKSVQCITHLARYFTRNEVLESVFFEDFWPKKVGQTRGISNIFEKKCTLGAAWWHRRHHAAAKCLLFFKIVRCIMPLTHFFGRFSVSKNHANRTIHLNIFKKSRSLAAAWWHRCSHLPREIATFFWKFHMYHGFDTLFFLSLGVAKPCKTLNTSVTLQKK